jgi:pantetheine-phosphate adenylyltransferase
MSERRIALNAGSFDPVTKGHEVIFAQASNAYDEVHIAIGLNPGKLRMFSVDQSLDMLREVTKPYPNITVGVFDHRFQVYYARSIGAKYLIRGIRNQNDLLYEQDIAAINRRIDPNITTSFLNTSPEMTAVSSSMVKSLVGFPGWEPVVNEFVHPYVLKKLREQYYLPKLEQWWTRCCECFGGGDDFFDLIRAAYTDDERFYHTVRHIWHGAEELELLGNIPFLRETLLAWACHDLVQNNRGGCQNERESSDMAKRQARSLGWEEDEIERTGRMVMATCPSLITDSPEERLVVDIDLKIFGEVEEAFDEYEWQIRREYAWVEESLFREKRSEILQGYLSRDRIYSSKYFYDKYEALARANLQRSLANLQPI